MPSFCRRQLLLLAWVLVARVSTSTADVFVAEELCQTSITVQYQNDAHEPMLPMGALLGPIVLGHGQNGATISLHPGIFIATAEVRICTDAGQPADDVAYRGVTQAIDLRSQIGRPISIVIHAIDIRQHAVEVAVGYDVPPVIMSIEIDPRTINVGEATTVSVSARDFNHPMSAVLSARGDTHGGEISRMSLKVFDMDTDRELGGQADQNVVIGSGDYPVPLQSSPTPNCPDGWTGNDGRCPNPVVTRAFSWTATEAMFSDSVLPVHRLRAEVTVTDTSGLSDFGVVAFTVNHNEAAAIGADTFRAPRINDVVVANQTYRTEHDGANSTPAEIRLSVYDSDHVTGAAYYTEDIFVAIEALTASTMGYNGQSHRIPSSSCNHTHGLASCEYVACACTQIDIAGIGSSCQELTVTKPEDTDGGTWSFKWNPWQNITAAAGRYGTTYCQLNLHFYDNTASLDGSMQSVPDGLRTRTATFLLVASPGTPDIAAVNHPPSVTSVWAAHTDVILGAVSAVGGSIPAESTITVNYVDTDSATAPTAVLVLGDDTAVDLVGGPVLTCANSSCTGVWTVDASELLVGSPVDIFLQLTDTVTQRVGNHKVATITVTQAPGRLRRARSGTATGMQRTVRSAPASTIITLHIFNGTLSGSTNGHIRIGLGGGSTTSPQITDVRPDGETTAPAQSTSTIIIASVAGFALLLLGIIAGIHCRCQDQPKAPMPIPMSQLSAADSAHLWPAAETNHYWPAGPSSAPRLGGPWPQQMSRSTVDGSV